MAPPGSDRSDPASADDPEALEALWLRPRRAERSSALTREAIVAAAMAIADAEGIDAVSIRRVAGALRARPMSLYSHFSRKQDLIDLMVNEAAGATLVPGQLPADWREALRMIAHHTRAAARRYPWMLSVVPKRAAIGPNALRHFDQSLAALSRLDVGREQKIAIMVAVDTYTVGQVVRELAGLPTSHGDETGDDAGTAGGVGAEHVSRLRAAEGYLRRLVETGEYPHIADFGIDSVIHAHEAETAAADRRFTDGLTWLIDGIAASLATERNGGDDGDGDGGDGARPADGDPTGV
ncbi:TetR/AcrR family transcriptional regulator C-terminal domain-containing protein [Pseudofrankia sp. BMG5.37]|uniref:TetR/AcrR family transcriptional regulator C-terminal domain-containing protein n=1 Tax=Pseudofrankia sp. BMG5.37 TaxID=3050035 RepID=UPI002894D0D4|nr:TetR/AcrR family transcriptional regulator C-terminal domain-containing protein [Pseudofrankia sp. BMG5.37]MDT3445163.1 TetR/AcrR family transcriptional regulator C-terminal domain-containing protein [Pseudofrankia sp. BMG5.37]